MTDSLTSNERTEDCTCLRSGYSHSYACRERLIDRQRAEIERLQGELAAANDLIAHAIGDSDGRGAHETSGHWRDVSQELPPDDGNDVLVTTYTRLVRSAPGALVCAGWRSAQRDNDAPYYTHWRPTPAPADDVRAPSLSRQLAARGFPKREPLPNDDQSEKAGDHCEHGIPRRFCTAVHPSENGRSEP